MSNDVVTYQGGGAVVPSGDHSSPGAGVITHAISNEVTLSNEDNFAIDQFGRLAAGHGLDRGGATKAAREYYTGVLREQKRQDENHRKQIRDQFTKEWGANYGANVKRIRSFIDSLPLSVQDVLWEGRTQDGALGLNDPSVLRWLLRLSHPAGAYQPGRHGVSGVEQEIADMRKLMQNPQSEYWKGPNAEKIQARYRDLLSMR